MVNNLDKTLRELTKELHWTRKVVVIKVYHDIKVLENKRWSFADTGRDLNLSKAFISEAVKLANCLKDNPELFNLSRKRALLKVRNLK